MHRMRPLFCCRSTVSPCLLRMGPGRHNRARRRKADGASRRPLSSSVRSIRGDPAAATRLRLVVRSRQDCGGAVTPPEVPPVPSPAGLLCRRQHRRWGHRRHVLILNTDGTINTAAQVADGAHRPISFTTYDNPGEAVLRDMYSGDSVTIDPIGKEDSLN